MQRLYAHMHSFHTQAGATTPSYGASQ